MNLPTFLIESLNQAHDSWKHPLQKALAALLANTPSYFDELKNDSFLPTHHRLFAAFSLPMNRVKYILVGEAPYPREESATGYAFMDGAVGTIWTEQGFEKAVSKATSLRNFLKMLLVAEGLLLPEQTKKEDLLPIAKRCYTHPEYIQRLKDLQDALIRKGFLLLNASLVYRKHIPAAKETKVWQPFFNVILTQIQEHCVTLPTLILWGKQAETLKNMPFPQVVSEHPYNLSFIQNQVMQAFFRPMNLLKKERLSH